MSLTVTIIAKLSGVDSRTAQRALRHGRGVRWRGPRRPYPKNSLMARAPAATRLATIAEFRPALFWGGLLGIAAVPVLMLVKVLHG